MVAVAVAEALSMAGSETTRVRAVYCGHGLATSGGGTAAVLEAGVTAPVVNVDAACASSSVALSLAVAAVRADQWDEVLVVGFEKMGRGMLRSARPHDPFGDRLGIEAQPVQYALKASWYLDRYDVKPADLAAVAVKSRAHGLLNPNAHIQQHVTLADVLGSPVVADPLTRFQCSPTSDGAAALVVRRARPRAHGAQVRVRSCRVENQLGAQDPDAGLGDATTARLATAAYAEAGIGADDVDVAQVHDAFTPGEVLRTEALGLCPEGEGARWAAAGRTAGTGDMPVNTDGGLLSRGHPLGATGAAQIVELVLQLTGRAGARQVERTPRTAVSQNSGGGENAATVVTVLAR
ncbi:thiolase [Pseudonocardia sulfidoxydans NBRC 16205]|uniref:propanoyl-CoA C-acyltransferase n=2 Tax=Pseudonocardia sulfidoxydans TaxID=54011 RepID=A0A511DEF5_9PSEU|nr:thiolase [Pseudonocardia sulfidoxydans NBRC 16205]